MTDKPQSASVSPAAVQEVAASERRSGKDGSISESRWSGNDKRSDRSVQRCSICGFFDHTAGSKCPARSQECRACATVVRLITSRGVAGPNGAMWLTVLTVMRELLSRVSVE